MVTGSGGLRVPAPTALATVRARPPHGPTQRGAEMYGMLASSSDPALQKQATLLPGASPPLSSPTPLAFPGFCGLRPSGPCLHPQSCPQLEVHSLVKQHGHHSVQLISVTFRRSVSVLNACMWSGVAAGWPVTPSDSRVLTPRSCERFLT